MKNLALVCFEFIVPEEDVPILDQQTEKCNNSSLFLGIEESKKEIFFEHIYE